MLTLEVGKKYLDNQGREWEVSDFEFASGLYTIKRDSGTINGWTYNSCLPGGRFSMQECLISEVPTTPQFKVGDRVRVKVPVPQYYTEMYGTIDREEDGRFGVVTFDNFGEWFYPSELEHLTDTSTTPSLVQCSCPTVVLMRDGCKCGHARKEIEQEFKQRGWK